MDLKTYLKILNLNEKFNNFNALLSLNNSEMKALDDKCGQLNLPYFSLFLNTFFTKELNVKIDNPFEVKLQVFFDHIGRQVYKNKAFYEQGMLNYIKRLNLKGNYIDAGANVGNHTVFFSKIAEKVYSFEPNVKSFCLLLKNIEQNNLTNVETFNKPLSNVHLKYNVYEVPHNMGMTNLTANEKGEVNSVVGDSLNIKNVSLIKIDCENMSFEVLKGFEKTIEKYKPEVFIEVDDHILKYIKKKKWIISGKFNSTPTYHIKTNN